MTEELPPVTTLHIDVVDDRGIHYQGSFIFKVPNMREEIEIGRRKSILLPVSVVNDTQAFLLAEMIAYLDVTIQKGEKNERIPDWWKPLEFFDPTPITALYQEASAYAKKFRGSGVTDGTRAASEDAEKQSSDDRSDVDGHVQPSVKRRTIHSTDSTGSAEAGASRRRVSE